MLKGVLSNDVARPMERDMVLGERGIAARGGLERKGMALLK